MYDVEPPFVQLMKSITFGVDFFGLGSLAVTRAKLVCCRIPSHAFAMQMTEMLSVVDSISVVNPVIQGLHLTL